MHSTTLLLLASCISSRSSAFAPPAAASRGTTACAAYSPRRGSRSSPPPPRNGRQRPRDDRFIQDDFNGDDGGYRGPTDKYKSSNNKRSADDDQYFQNDFDDNNDFDWGNIDDDSDELAFDINTEDSAASNSPPKAGAHFFSRKPLQDPTFVLVDEKSNDIFEKLCQGAGITRPSRIQSAAWPVLLEGKHAIVADQTGSGKTLAYLIPLLQRALATPSKNNSENGPKLNGAPKVLVLAPTSELADQVRSVCDQLSQHAAFKTMVVTATGKYSTSIRDQIRMLQRQPVDVLISTPGRLATILRTRNSGLDLSSQLQAMVLDEVDVLMMKDDSSGGNSAETFGPQLRTIGQAAPVERVQFVFVTATLPDAIVETVEREFASVVQIRGPGLHRTAPTLKERLIDVSVPSAQNRDTKLGLQRKGQQLMQVLRLTRCRRTLIFCNTVQTCRAVENLLNRHDRQRQRYRVLAYHNAMTPEARNANFQIFSKAGQGGGYNKTNNHDEEKTRTSHLKDDVDYILVCTDRAGRGVDFDAAPVDHVVLFDFPRDPAEYVRRVGRTARAGRTGTSTVFAYGWQLPIARQVMGSTLESVASGARQGDDDTDNAAEVMGGVKGRRHQQQERQKHQPKQHSRNPRDDAVKGNIEKSRTWKGPKL